jgi:hypothetical protein
LAYTLAAGGFRSVRDVFKEDEAEDDMYVFGRVHVAAEFVRGLPKLGLEA